MRFKNDIQVLCLLAVMAWGLVGCGAAQVGPLPLTAEHLTALRVSAADGLTVPVGDLLQRAKATAFVFWAAGCPCVRRYQERIDDLAARWSARGVQVLGIAANADETLDDVAKARQQHGFALTVWRDRGGSLARALGVTSTPTVVVLLPDGAVAYRGWIDNERLPGDPGRQAWLDDALTRVVAGDQTAEVRPVWGCRITQGEPDDAPAAAVPADSAPPAAIPVGSTSAEPPKAEPGCRCPPSPGPDNSSTVPAQEDLP